MIILSIETSCDETSLAIVDKTTVVKQVTISQILELENYKGVNPGLASKLHVYNIKKILEEIISFIQKKNIKIDCIAYTKEPGLIICLQIGEIVAKTIALYLRKPIYKINHLHGHIFSSLINNKEEIKFPALSLIISGGHTSLYKLKSYNEIELIGYTLDDAVGECLDKVSILLGENYPGGPIIEKLAKNWEIYKKNNSIHYKLTVPKVKGLNFSFSGLKSQVARLIKKSNIINITDKSNLSFSLQEIIVKFLINKIIIACKKEEYCSLLLGGGVIANNYFKEKIINFCKRNFSKLKVFTPINEYSTDNAAMIGVTAYLQKLLR